MFRERVRNKEGLLRGSQNLTRIHVRKDLCGVDVQPEIFLAVAGQEARPVAVRQYSFKAFARFYYNRICTAVEGDYECLPPQSLCDVMMSVGDEVARTQRPETTLATRTRLLDQLCACVTPNPNPTTVPDFFTQQSRLPRYRHVPHQSAKAAEFAFLALQMRLALLILHAMRKAG